MAPCGACVTAFGLRGVDPAARRNVVFRLGVWSHHAARREAGDRRRTAATGPASRASPTPASGPSPRYDTSPAAHARRGYASTSALTRGYVR